MNYAIKELETLKNNLVVLPGDTDDRKPSYLKFDEKMVDSIEAGNPWDDADRVYQVNLDTK